jgi:hypothetical protein
VVVVLPLLLLLLLRLGRAAGRLWRGAARGAWLGPDRAVCRGAQDALGRLLPAARRAARCCG